MTDQQLKKLQKDVDTAGLPSDTRRFLWTGIVVLEKDNHRITQAKSATTMLFAQKLAAWWSLPVDKLQIPFTIAHDVSRATHYIYAACGCVSLESLLAAWIFKTRLHQPPFYGASIAVLCALLFHGAFLMLFRNAQRPKEEVDRIASRLLKPALWLFALSFTILLLARTVRGTAAAMLVNLLNVSLWTSTIGLIALAGALFSGAFILRWSRHDDRAYRMLEREQAANDSYIESFKDQIKRLDDAPPLNTKGAPEPTPKAPPISGAAATAMMLALIFIPFAASCGNSTIIAEASDEIGRELVISADFSGSPVDPAYATFVRTLQSNLAMMVETAHFNHIRVLHFGADGWVPEVVLDLKLSKPKIVQVRTNDGGEIGGLDNIREALEAETAAEVAVAQQSVKEGYRQSIKRELSAVSDDVLRPPQNFRGSHCTDLIGHLHYIRRMSGSQPIVVLLITDGGQNCTQKLESVERPDTNVSLAIVLLPEKIEQLKRSQKEDGRTQYDSRSPRIAAAVPWAVIVPYFNEDLPQVMMAAINKK